MGGGGGYVLFILVHIYMYNASFEMHTCSLNTSDKIWIVCLICTFCNSQYTVKNKNINHQLLDMRNSTEFTPEMYL